jgi:hypothetical protein
MSGELDVWVPMQNLACTVLGRLTRTSRNACGEKAERGWGIRGGLGGFGRDHTQAEGLDSRQSWSGVLWDSMGELGELTWHSGPEGCPVQCNDCPRR